MARPYVLRVAVCAQITVLPLLVPGHQRSDLCLIWWLDVLIFLFAGTAIARCKCSLSSLNGKISPPDGTGHRRMTLFSLWRGRFCPACLQLVRPHT